MTAIIRPEAVHRAAWGRLYAGYATFYGVTQTEPMRERVWHWINDPAHEVEALVALDGDGRLIGLAHFRRFSRPLSATTGGFLDDLFVDPEARGRGVAELLIQAVAGIGRERGWSVIRWSTAEDNATARRLYERVAKRTPWVTYDVGLSG